MEFEIAILPSLLFAAQIVCEEAAEFCNGRALRCGEGRRAGRASQGGGHGASIDLARVERTVDIRRMVYLRKLAVLGGVEVLRG